MLRVGAFLPRSSARLPLPSGTIDLRGDRNYARYHHVLNRAARSPLRVSQVRPRLLLRHLDRGDGPLVFGIDETLGRRQGPRIGAPDINRDAVHPAAAITYKVQSRTHVKTAGKC